MKNWSNLTFASIKVLPLEKASKKAHICTLLSLMFSYTIFVVPHPPLSSHMVELVCCKKLQKIVLDKLLV